MARGPRLTGDERTRAIKSVDREFPLFSGLVTADADESRDNVIKRLTDLHTAESAIEGEGQQARRMASVNNLIEIGGLIEYSILRQLIKPDPRTVQDFIVKRAPYTYSYIMQARRLYNNRHDIHDAVDWYIVQSQKRGETGWKYRTSQASGVVFVREAMRAREAFDEGMKQYHDDGTRYTEADALRYVDDMYPMIRPQRQPPGENTLTPQRRRDRWESIGLYAISLVHRLLHGDATEQDHEDASRLVEQWDTPEAFVAWVNEDNFSNAQAEAVREVRNLSTWYDRLANLPWQPGQAVEPRLGATPAAAPARAMIPFVISLSTPEEMVDEAMQQSDILALMQEHKIDEAPMRAFILTVINGGNVEAANKAASEAEGRAPPRTGVIGLVREIVDILVQSSKFATDDPDIAAMVTIYTEVKQQGLPLAEQKAEFDRRMAEWAKEHEEQAEKVIPFRKLLTGHHDPDAESDEGKAGTA